MCLRCITQYSVPDIYIAYILQADIGDEGHQARTGMTRTAGNGSQPTEVRTMLYDYPYAIKMHCKPSLLHASDLGLRLYMGSVV